MSLVIRSKTLSDIPDDVMQEKVLSYLYARELICFKQVNNRYCLMIRTNVIFSRTINELYYIRINDERRNRNYTNPSLARAFCGYDRW